MAAQDRAGYAQLEQEAQALSFGEGRLFRVTRANTPTSFLFATLHIVDPRIAQLTPATRDALRSSSAVALETLDFDGRFSPRKSEADLAALPAERASRLLDPIRYRQLETLLAGRGFPAVLADRLKASALALMLDLPRCATRGEGQASFPDERVLAAAKDAGTPVVGLETLAEQVSVADGLSAPVQKELLEAVLTQSDEAESAVATSVALYTQGRIGLLSAWNRSPRPFAGVPNAGIPPAFVDLIITARTRRMRERLDPLLRRGGVFVAVGAAHIPGRDGLASLLVADGYAVERIE